MQDLQGKINTYLQGGIIDFSDNPKKYSGQALRDLAKDYWDLGVALVGATAWSQYSEGIS